MENQEPKNNTKVQKKEPKIKKFWQDGFSIDETRVSALIILLFILTIFALTLAVLNIPIPDIPVGIKEIITTLIWAICGVNVFNKVSSFFNPYNNSTYSNYGNNYGSNYGYNNYSNGYSNNNSYSNYDNNYSTNSSNVQPSPEPTSSSGRESV